MPHIDAGIEWEHSQGDNQAVRQRTNRKERLMVSHSTVTSKGQTTIPGAIREALKIKPGDRLEYVLIGDRAAIRVHPGAHSLKGILASDKGKGMTFDQIRKAAAANAVKRWRKSR